MICVAVSLRKCPNVIDDAPALLFGQGLPKAGHRCIPFADLPEKLPVSLAPHLRIGQIARLVFQSGRGGTVSFAGGSMTGKTRHGKKFPSFCYRLFVGRNRGWLPSG